MRLENQPQSPNVVDKTDRVFLKGLIELTPEETEIMQKNNWTPKDMLVLRQIKMGILNYGTRGPDRWDAQMAPTHQAK